MADLLGRWWHPSNWLNTLVGAVVRLLEVGSDRERSDRTGNMPESEDCHTGRTRRLYGRSSLNVDRKSKAFRIL